MSIKNILGVEFIEGILRNSENDESINVNNVTSEAATASGDNYMSYMIRAKVDYTRNESGQKINEKKSLIFKIAPESDEIRGDMGRKFGAFEKEIGMMQDTLLRMKNILNEKDCHLSTRPLYTQIENPCLIAMEDLTELGFRMADRHAGLDFEHCLFVITKLAKFHASSVALYEKDPRSIDRYMVGVYHENCCEEIKKFIRDAVKTLGNEVINWTELSSCYSEKILKLSEVCFEKAVECVKISEDQLNVINHGDCWTNNMLFRYNDEGKIIDHIFIDFQTSVWTTPALDVMYFLYTSPDDDVLIRYYDELLKAYAKTLAETMSRLGCKTKPPNTESIREYLKARDFFAFICSTLSLPFILLEKTEVIDLSELFKPGSDYVNPGYKGKAFRKIMVRRLKEWNSRGILNV